MKRIVTAVACSCFVAAVAGLVLTGNDQIHPSSDSGASASVWTVLAQAAVLLAATRLLPPVMPEQDPPDVDRGLRRALVVLGSMAVVFPLVWFVVLLAGVNADAVGGLWAVNKPVLFLLVPWLLLRGRVDRLLPSIRGESLWRPVGWWRWAGAAAVVGAYSVLRTVGPLASAPPRPGDYPDPLILAIGASITFVTANIVEELYFRVALQTRVEALLGRWGGILLTSLVFGLMHLPTHGQTNEIVAGLPLTLAVIVAYQGTFGVAAGYLWSRYRNVWANIAFHSVANTLPLMFLL